MLSLVVPALEAPRPEATQLPQGAASPSQALPRNDRPRPRGQEALSSWEQEPYGTPAPPPAVAITTSASFDLAGHRCTLATPWTHPEASSGSTTFLRALGQTVLRSTSLAASKGGEETLSQRRNRDGDPITGSANG